MADTVSAVFLNTNTKLLPFSRYSREKKPHTHKAFYYLLALEESILILVFFNADIKYIQNNVLEYMFQPQTKAIV